jgi:hypothetical protein
MKKMIRMSGRIVVLFLMVTAFLAPRSSFSEDTTYYVDAVAGNDHSDGTTSSSAWQSLDKVNSMVFKPGDRILFKANCTWTGGLEPKGSGDDKKQIVVDMYGYESLPRNIRNKPHIEGNGIYATVLLKDVEYWTISNLDVSNSSSATDIKLRNGIMVLAKAAGITHRVIIQDCEVHDVHGDYRRRVGMYKNSGIRVSFPGTSTSENRYDEVLVQRNYVHDVRTNGIYIVSEADSREETFYTNVKVANNTIIRTGADGAIISHCISPVVEHNMILDSGYYGNYQSTNYIAGLWGDNNTGEVLFQNNEVARTHKFMGDGQAFDTDWGTGGTSVYQYNYTHENKGGFFLNCIDCAGGKIPPTYVKSVIRYNISVDDEESIINRYNETIVEVYNNVFYKTSGNLDPGSSKTFKYFNNIFNFTTDPEWGISEYSNNCYYPIARNGNDGKGISANPRFMRAGIVGDGKKFADFYKLQPKSPCIDAGIVISDNGGKDYWGKTLYNGLPDVGAMEYYIEVKK